MKSILPNFNCMRTAEVQFSEIKLIWSLKYILGRWDGGSVDGGRWDGATVDGDRWDGGRCFWKTPEHWRTIRIISFIGNTSEHFLPKKETSTNLAFVQRE